MEMIDPLTALLVAFALIGLAAILFFPNRGVVQRWRRARQQSERILVEDALKHILNCEMSGDRFTVNSIAGALQITVDSAGDLLLDMEQRGLLHMRDDAIRLTPVGRQSALHILRAHRLWERHLADETGIEELAWHGIADEYEHQISPEEAEALAARLGNPTHDPHGDPIPSAEGEMLPHGGIPLISADVGEPLQIVHIEDAPQTVFAQLLAEGLYPGMDVRIVERTPHRIRFWAGGDEHLLAPVVAANISVSRPPDDGSEFAELRLSDLKQGQSGQIVGISSQCRGLERRRLQDLGFLPGASIQAELTSSGGDPVAYRIRGALVALREEQAEMIHIELAEQPA